MWTFLRRSIPVALVVMLLWVPFVAASGQPASALGALWAAATPGFPAASASRLHRAAPQRVTGAVWSATADGAKAEVLVLLRDQADLAPFTHGAVQDRGRRVVQALQQTAATSQASLRAWLEAREVPYRVFYIVNALLVEADEGLLRALARRPEVAQIMANPQVAMALPPNEPVPQPLSMAWVDAIEWGVAKIGAPEVWALGYRGQGVVVAGQDTGYDWEHPALQRQYRGWNGAVASHDYNWHDAIHSGGGICGPDSPMPCDDNGHGTHTMGTIVGDDGADRQIGVAPEARWIGCRNMSQGVGTPATYAECFEFFLAPYPVGATSAEGDPDRAPDVINNSWSCPPYEGCDAENIAFLEAVVENVRAAGILVVASAGNRGPTCGTVDQPAGMYDATFTVGATGSDDAIAAFSSRGTGTSLIKPDIVAPGVGVTSALPGGGYGVKSGTSMAAPHVVGVAALALSAGPALRGQVTTLEALLTSNTEPYTSTQCGDAFNAIPNSVYGWGRLEALDAVRGALEGPGAIAGMTVDQHNQALTDVRISAARDAFYVWQDATDAHGLYRVEPLSGTYTLTVTHPLFPSQTYAGVVVSAGLTTTLNITLTRPFLLFLPVLHYTP